jgi:hypothetical protein
MGEFMSEEREREDYEEYYPDQYECLCKEGKIEEKKKFSPDNKLIYGCFLRVNNTGLLYGEYNKEQQI